MNHWIFFVATDCSSLFCGRLILKKIHIMGAWSHILFIFHSLLHVSFSSLLIILQLWLNISIVTSTHELLYLTFWKLKKTKTNRCIRLSTKKTQQLVIQQVVYIYILWHQDQKYFLKLQTTLKNVKETDFHGTLKPPCTCPHVLHIYVKGQLLNIFAADYLKIVRSSCLKTHISLLGRQFSPGISIFFHFFWHQWAFIHI